MREGGREKKKDKGALLSKAVATVTSSRCSVSCSAKTTGEKSEKAAIRAIARLTQLVSVEDAMAR